MGVPHQVLPFVAVADAVTGSIAAIQLGLVPTPALLTVQGSPTLGTFFSRLMRTAPLAATHKTSHIILIEQANPKRLLLVMLASCLARCSVISIVWASIRNGIRAGRVGSRSEDYTGRAVGYSLICIISILLNLFILNLLFQSRGAPPSSSLKDVLLHMSASSLAGEQLIISAFEWILFVLVVGTNGLRAVSDEEPVRQLIEPSASSSSAAEASTVIDSQEVEIAAVAPHTLQNGQAKDMEIAEATGQSQQKKDYGALSQSSTAVNSSTTDQTDAVAAIQPQQTSFTATSNEESDDQTTAVSSDIVDMPTDRRVSMMSAKERLQRAREEGKVRRRSLWKKIRGKGGESRQTSQEPE